MENENVRLNPAKADNMPSKIIQAHGTGYNIYKYPASIADAKKHKVSLSAGHPNRIGTKIF